MTKKQEELDIANKELLQAYMLASRIARSTIAVIDTVVQRGGFKGEELSTIGQLRDQSVHLIEMSELKQTEQATMTPTTPSEK